MSSLHLQDTSTWTCEGDSGSPLIHERRPQEFYLMGVLYGSRSVDCTPRTFETPGLFANLEHPLNLDFINKWKNVGDFFLKDNLEDLEMQTSLSINYLKHLDPNQAKQSLWRHYTNDEDIYSIIFFKICQNSTYSNDNFENYGVDCTLYNSKIFHICSNGKSSKENFEIFGVNCSSK